ncbi:hypothetical protein [uncultured Croceitalea sp.]|uniref:hypothetical protein n=1 Tax=uncultured Croceitalea sp. TaxID=1798908 RepID=UPI003306761C
MAKLLSLCTVFILISCGPKTKENQVEQTATAMPTFDYISELPKAVIYDTEMELDFIAAMNTHQEHFVVNEIIVTSNRWAMSFNASGQIVARSRTATVIANLEDKCYLKEVVFEQKALGEEFGNTKIVTEKSWYEFNCKLQENKNPGTMAGVQFEEE